MPLIARQRSRLAVLAVLALVGSLLAVSAVPVAAAVDRRPSNLATYSACVAAATEDGGFTDTGHSFAQGAINCLVHYGITEGTTPTTFAPDDPITRRQMALFLTRAAGPAQLDLPDVMDMGFTDLGNLGNKSRNAINQLAELGVMAGVSSTSFDPDGYVSRADMAVFIDGFLANATIGPGGLGGATKYSDLMPRGNFEPNDEPFSDIGSVSYAAYGAIRRIYELGITEGTRPAFADGSRRQGTFSPDTLVSRAQMAAFITRALDHTNARPAGLAIQSDKTQTHTGSDGNFMLHVSARDDNHQPDPDVVIDVFSDSSASRAFDDDGLCEDLNSVTDPAASSARCEVDTGDESTDPDGNLEYTIETAGYCAGGTKQFWAWTAPIGSKFNANEDDAASTSVHIGVGVSLPKDNFKHSTTAAGDATHVRFGETVDFTVQLVDKNGDPVAEKNLTVLVHTLEVAKESEGSIVKSTRVQSDLEQRLPTGSDGEMTLSYSFDDPDPDNKGHSVTVTVTRRSDINGDRLTDGTDTDTLPDYVEVSTLTWSDADPVPSTLKLDQSAKYHQASDAGSGVRNTLTATLLDQYADPVSGATIHFWSDANNGDRLDNGTVVATPTGLTQATWLGYSDNHANNGLGGAQATVNSSDSPVVEITYRTAGSARTWNATNSVYDGNDSFASSAKTNRRGVAWKSYHRDSDTAMTEEIGIVYVVGKRDGALTEDLTPDNPNDDLTANAEIDDMHATVTHYWATVAGSVEANGPVRVADTDADTAVVDTDTSAASGTGNRIVKYDGNDQFNFGAENSPVAVDQATFESKLKVGNTLVYDLSADPGPGVNRLRNVQGTVDAATVCHAP